MRHVRDPAAPNLPLSAASAIAFCVASIKPSQSGSYVLGQSIRMAHDNGHRLFIVGYWFVGDVLLISGFLVETGRVRVLANVLAVDSILLDTKLCC